MSVTCALHDLSLAAGTCYSQRKTKGQNEVSQSKLADDRCFYPDTCLILSTCICLQENARFINLQQFCTAPVHLWGLSALHTSRVRSLCKLLHTHTHTKAHIYIHTHIIDRQTSSKCYLKIFDKMQCDHFKYFSLPSMTEKLPSMPDTQTHT